jgi:tetratricopeptide (TPR) repeat protein
MGIRALFGLDPEADLVKAERLLGEGEAVRALELATRAARSDRREIQARGEELAARARAGILTNVLERAAAAEGEGAFETAASWLDSALLHETSAERRTELETRRAKLLDRAEEKRNPFGRERGTLLGDDEEPAAHDDEAPGDGEASLDDRYDTLVAMMTDAAAAHWEGRPREVRQALVDLNEGNVGAALPALEALVAAHPADGVLRLERGRARRLAGDLAGAREDFEAAWKDLGDDPLDATDTLSAPALAAEAALEAGDAATVVGWLRDHSDPRDRRVELCHLYGSALLATGDDEALPYLQRAAGTFARDPRFPLLLARAMEQAGDPQGAIACLEVAVRPVSGRGRQAAQAHAPSLRALAELHLEHGTDADRPAELMARLAHEQEGLLGPDDHALLARYYRRRGDEEAAAWCESEARRLRERGGDLSAAPAALGVGEHSAL